MGIIDGGYSLTQLLSGACRVLFAPDTVTKPANISDLIGMVSPYTLDTDFDDIGATTGPASYSRSIESEGLSVEQVKGNVVEDVTDVTRSFTLPVGAITPENLQVLENAGTIGTISAAANKSAQHKVEVGSFDELTKYRVAFIGLRPKGAGTVTEPGGATRGRMLAFVAYYASISADESSLSIGKGQLASMDMSFTLFPDPAVSDQTKAQGIWLSEDAGTISAS